MLVLPSDLEGNIRATITLKDTLTLQGYALIRGYLPDEPSSTAVCNIGKAVSFWGDDPVQQLVPTEQSAATPNTYSGIYGLRKFPFHTDLAHWRFPPRYLMLRCVVGHPEVPTFLIDSHDIITSVTLDVLSRAVVKPRRPRNGTLSLLRICEPTDEGQLFRWDEVFLKPASKVGELGVKRVHEAIHMANAQPIAIAKPGDTLVIDNWRMLHARAPVPPGREDRIIERIYLEAIN